MSILVADSGSTKTDWRLLQDGKIRQSHSEGLNPYFHSEERLSRIVGQVITDLQAAEHLDTVHFYGAGLGEPETQAKIKAAFRLHVAPHVSIHTYSDMLAAARAAAGQEPGIVGIMGTGGNACRYDGSQSIQNVAAPGYVFGDEGCGAWIGIQLLKGVLRQDWPQHLLEVFAQEYPLSTSDILAATYKGPKPNTFLAGFVPFVEKHQQEAPFREMLLEGFRSYIRYYLKPLQTMDKPPLFLVGGVAHSFQNLLMPLLRQEGFQLKRILPKPIAGLSLYHQNG
jgi:N-acetylglucosamine kinase-like BadF-type ATPase